MGTCCMDVDGAGVVKIPPNYILSFDRMPHVYMCVLIYVTVFGKTNRLVRKSSIAYERK